MTTYLIDAFTEKHNGYGPVLTLHGFSTSTEAVEFAATVVSGTTPAEWEHGSIVGGAEVFSAPHGGQLHARFAFYEVLSFTDGVHSDPLVRGTFRLDGGDLAARNEKEAPTRDLARLATNLGIDLGNPPPGVCVGGCLDCLTVRA